MLVKKFEAPTMKEALGLVKTHLGPEAIILSAKDNSKGFGLAGNTSVEVTAAVSEIQLKKKQLAEARLAEPDKNKLKVASAKKQKEFIQKSVNRYLPKEEVVPRAPEKPLRYIDIQDELKAPARASINYASIPLDANVENVEFVEEQPDESSQHRVREAARSAFSVAQQTFKELIGPSKESTVASAPVAFTQKAHAPQNIELLSLQSEVRHLKSLLETFKKSSRAVVSLHPGAEDGLPYEMSFLYTKLTDSGLSKENASNICQRALKELSPEHIKKRALVDAWAAKHILNSTTLVSEPYPPGIHLFVGAAGQGKTSMLVKIASHLVVKEHKSVVILTADTRRVGAAEQLKIYSQILNVPFATVSSKQSWSSMLPHLKNTHAILVDFPGLSLKALDEIDYLQSLLPPNDVKKTVHIVQSVNQKESDAFEVARRYRLLNINDVIFTKLDEAANHGLIYNFQKEIQLPLHSFGIGPLIPEDYELATKERVVDLIFKISKLKHN